MASLTEAAKAVLEGKTLVEGAYPEVSPGKISNPNPVDPSTASTGNAKTLRPGSKGTEGRFANPNGPDAASFSGVDDLDGQTPTETPDENLGAAAAKKVGKDTSRAGKGAVAGEAMKKMSMSEEEDFDGEIVEEGMTIAERLKAIKEAKKADKEDDDDHEEKESKAYEKKEEKCAKEMDEDIELSEELEAFIEEGIELGLSEEEILAAIDENFEFISEEEQIEELYGKGSLGKIKRHHEKEAKKATKKAETRGFEGGRFDRKAEFHSDTADRAKGLMAREEYDLDEDYYDAMEEYQVDMTEHVNALLEGENLSEEFHAKATTIFEAAVKAKLEEEVALLEQAYAETLEERVAQIEEELSSQVDEYLNYVVEQWIEENEVAVESALRSELTEDFISGLRSLFAEHYIDVPEEEVQVVEELSQTVEALEAKLNEEIQRNVELTSMLSESRKAELTAVVCEGLTSTQAAKLQALAEGVDYTSDEEFIEKVHTLKENYFPVSAKNDAVLDKVEASDPQSLNENLEGPMSRYVQALGRSLPN